MKRKKFKKEEKKEAELKLYAEPGTSSENMTGRWRSMYPIVDRKTCFGCKLCQQYCPDSCIKIINKKSVIDLKYCKGDGICAAECPVKAISMKEEEK
jgi:pyruvate ferredoxin oxidoreductase delta subunit